MKKIICSVVLIFLLIGLSGCANGYKKYGVGTAHQVGYDEFEIGKNKYKVTYTGSVTNTHQEVMKYTYQRAKELCKEKGFSNYEFYNTDMSNKESSSMTTSYGKYGTFTDKKSQNIYSLDVECK